MSKQRSNQLERVAFNMGMEYHPTDEWGLPTLLKDFRLFRRGRSKRIRYLMHKEDDWLQMSVRVFDYRFVIGGGKHRRVLNQTVFFVDSKKLGLPHFLMRPEHFFHKIGQFLGMQDIDFAEFPKFSDQYLLKGEDEEYIRATMNDDMLKFFTVEKDWYLEGVNYFLIFYKQNYLFPPKQIKKFYEQGLNVYKMLTKNQKDF